ncbi:MAG TPA: DUF1036 domain-containing protein [Candidatus Tumulicola sp.]|nr:DUF1036 domain-containing protein [Candidatus Tumulicola sp.]
MDRKIIIATVSAVAAILFLAAPRPAQASLQICNKSSERIDTAVAYYYDDGLDAAWESEGWWVLQPGQCATPVSYDLDYRYYYVFGNGPSHYWGGTYNFCVDMSTKFDFLDSDTKCPNGTWKGFRRIDTENYKQYTWSFND